MNNQNSIKQRLLAVLDYDDIPASRRATHMAAISGLSLSTARRMLGDGPSNIRRLHRWLFQLAHGLDVHWRWLYDGDFERFEPRTARIYLSQIKQWTPAKIDATVLPLLEGIESEPDYLSVGDGCSPMIVIAMEQMRRMTEWEKNKYLRFCIRLRNDDKKALRLAEMCARGQITRTQLFSMM